MDLDVYLLIAVVYSKNKQLKAYCIDPMILNFKYFLIKLEEKKAALLMQE
jgi:hypothetical protein